MGWTTFALYLLAFACSLRFGLAGDKAETQSEIRQVWRLQAGVLLVLGLNKQLDLQTLLIGLGRQLALAAAWYEHRREIHIIFFTGLVAVLVLAMLKHSPALKRFAREHTLTAAGDALVGAYVLIRILSIDHVDNLLGFDLEKVPALSVVEILGLFLVTAGAIKAKPATRTSSG